MLDARAGTRSAHRSKSHGRIANEKCTEATFSSAQQRQRWSGISNEQSEYLFALFYVCILIVNN